eukprot:248156-Pyramimonas_sp.AAC.2
MAHMLPEGSLGLLTDPQRGGLPRLQSRAPCDSSLGVSLALSATKCNLRSEKGCAGSYGQYFELAVHNHDKAVPTVVPVELSPISITCFETHVVDVTNGTNRQGRYRL